MSYLGDRVEVFLFHPILQSSGQCLKDSPSEQTSSLELRAEYSHNIHDGMCHKEEVMAQKTRMNTCGSKRASRITTVKKGKQNASRIHAMKKKKKKKKKKTPLRQEQSLSLHFKCYFIPIAFGA
jgi:hypothetical protein